MKYFPDPDNTIVNLQLTRDEFLLFVELCRPIVTFDNEGLTGGLQDFVNFNVSLQASRGTELDLHKVFQGILNKLDKIHPTLTCWHCGEKFDTHPTRAEDYSHD